MKRRGREAILDRTTEKRAAYPVRGLAEDRSGQWNASILQLAEAAQGNPSQAGDMQWEADPLPEHTQKRIELFSGSCPPRLMESARQLRGRVVALREFWAGHGAPLRSVAIVGPEPGSGASFVSRNLAASLAMASRSRVLLVDCDLGKASLRRRLGVEAGAGLSEVMQGASWQPLVKCIPGTKLHVLTSGHAQSNWLDDTHLLRLPETLEALAQHFEWLICDASPLPSSAGEAIHRAADGTLVVLRRDQTAFEAADDALRHLDRSRLLGLFLNGA